MLAFLNYDTCNELSLVECCMDELLEVEALDPLYDRIGELNLQEQDEAYRSIDESLYKMIQNGHIFIPRLLFDTKWYNIFLENSLFSIGNHTPSQWSEMIDGKNILILDDTITSGKKISYQASLVKKLFSPNTVTYLSMGLH